MGTGKYGGKKLGIKKRSFWKREQKIRQTEESIRDLPHERAYIFDKDGNIVWQSKTSEESDDSVTITGETEDMILTHNHPDRHYADGSMLEGGTFSNGRPWTMESGDVKNFAHAQLAELRASDSQRTYVLRRGKDARVFDFARAYADATEKYLQQAKDDAHRARVNGIIGWKNGEYSKYAMNAWLTSLHTWLKNNASHYGVEYHVYERRRKK